MDANPLREQLIFERRHNEDIQRGTRYRAIQPVNGRLRCLLCGLGHRLVWWGRYLEDHFAPPESSAKSTEKMRHRWT